MGILCVLWDRQASDAHTNVGLVLHITDFSLVQSLRASSASFLSEVWLHETVRRCSPVHFSGLQQPKSYPPGAYTPTELGMHLSHSSTQTGISPMSSLRTAHGNSDSLGTS